MIAVEPADPKAQDTSAILAQSHALMNTLFPADACHYLDLDALCAPNIRFFAARIGGTTLGTGALAVMEGYGEVKSMFTAPEGARQRDRGSHSADGRRHRAQRRFAAFAT